MDFLIQLFTNQSTAQTIFLLGLIIASGIALGSVKFFGIRLGVAGVLFTGLIFGHFKLTIDHQLLDFVREFGLVLFVYTIGVQVGPGFFSSLKKNGLVLNGLAASVVLLGTLIAVLLYKYASIPLPAAVGFLSGATTNTPSLAAAQQALSEIPGISPELINMPGVAYAIAYPFGIFGIILTMILVRAIFRVAPLEESHEFDRAHTGESKKLEVADIRVENMNLNGVEIEKIPGLQSGVVISRILHENVVDPARSDTKVFLGDIIRAVGPRKKLEDLRVVVGSFDQMESHGISSHIIARKVIVSLKSVVGRSIGELDIRNQYGVTITRIIRSDIELPVDAYMELQLADTLMVVGEERAIKKFAEFMGDSRKNLDHPNLIPVFIGIALGVILGSWPIQIASMPAPIKLGLAGGPLVVAIILSRIGKIGKLVWYMPDSANYMLREVGICLFLACVGLKSGDQFLRTLVEGQGLYWMAFASIITVVPILIVAIVARLYFKMNFLTICGLLAGSMTDPPALAFANHITPSNAQVMSYATVYPLVMILRVVLAQLIVMVFM